MPKVKSFLIIMIAILFAFPVIAQEEGNQMWLATEAIVKSEKIADFEKSFQEIARLFKEHNHPYSWSVFQSTGFKYYWFIEMETLADYDKILATSKETWTNIDPEVFNKFAACFESYKRFIINGINDISYFPETPRQNWEETNYVMWDVHYLKPGLEEKYMGLVKKFMELAREIEFHDPILFIEGGLGTDMPMYAGVLYGKDHIDMRVENKKLIEAMGEE
jgi:hypothetical protein